MTSLKQQFFNLDEIIVNRELLPGDDLSELVQDIHAAGLEVPILVDGEMNLVDGLRRLEAVRSMGSPIIPVIVASTYDEACQMIEHAHQQMGFPDLPVRRIWQLSQSLRAYAERQRANSLRGPRRGRIPREEQEKLKHERRTILSKALGFKSPARIQAICYVYRAAMYDDTARGDMARAMVPEMEAGGSPYLLAEHISGRKPNRLTGDITSLSEQRIALKVALANLTGLVKGLERIGPPHSSLTQRERDEFIEGLSMSRGSLARFIRLFREETQK